MSEYMSERMSECQSMYIYMMPFILPDDMSETIDYGRMVCQGGDHWKYFFIETVHLLMVSQSVNTLKHGECNKSNIMLPATGLI